MFGIVDRIIERLGDEIVSAVASKVHLNVVESLRLEITRFELKPGEILVIRPRQPLPESGYKRLQQMIGDVVPEYADQIIVMDDWLELAGILSKSDVRREES